MMKHNLCALMLFVALFSSCDRVPEHALQQAGDNRAELERALAHFKDGSSPEKYSAAKFLIENMPYQLTYEGEGMELLDSAYLVMSEATVQTRNDVFMELTRDARIYATTTVSDIKTLDADHLIRTINDACDVWQSSSWSSDYPFSIFCDYVLPYRILDEQPSEWRSLAAALHPSLSQPSVLSKRGEQLEAESAEAAADAVEAEGASGGSMMLLGREGSHVTFTLNQHVPCAKHLYVRYTSTAFRPRLAVSVNGAEADTVHLHPTQAMHTFTFSREECLLRLPEGESMLTLSYAGDSVGIDHIQLNALEEHDESRAEDYAGSYCQISNKQTGNCIAIEAEPDTLPCAAVARPYSHSDSTQLLRLDCRGYACWSIAAYHPDSDVYLETMYCSLDRNATVGLYKYLNGSNQKWVFLPVEEGYFRIMNKDSGLFLEAREGEKADTLVQNPYTGSDAQKWRVERRDGHPHADPTFRKGSAISEALRVFDITGQYEWVGYSSAIPPKGSSLLTGKTGNCRDEADYTVYLCRSLGIPAAVDFTPHWGNRSLSHSWSVLVKPDGTGTPFYMGCAPCDTAHYYHPYKKPKVFRYRFSLNRQYASDLKGETDVPRLFRLPRFTDVTDEYYETTDVVRPVPADSAHRRIAYVCVFDNRNWVPVHYGSIRNGEVTFTSMGRNIMYMAAFYEDGEVKPFGDPFCIEADGTVRDIVRNDQSTEAMKLLRKYPFMGKEDFFNLRMSGGMFQGSNDADFAETSCFYMFEGVTNGNWYEVEVQDSAAYRYLRYIGPPSSHCNINEMEFYDEQGEKIEGTIIGTEGDPWALKEKAFDGDILTGFSSISPDGNWVGLKLRAPRKVSRFRFIGRNDGNGIEVGDNYELMCWRDGWKTLGVQTASSNELIFDSVPSGGLYVLRNRTKGHEERIFTYENGEQVWW